jgi:hypothetical protein
MGKGSGKAKMPKDDAFDKAIKEQGPGLSDPTGPILQLTGMGQAPGMAGQIDFANPGFSSSSRRSRPNSCNRSAWHRCRVRCPQRP